jgi:hypothetical protein
MPRAAVAFSADAVESAAVGASSRSTKRKKTSHEEEEQQGLEGAEDAVAGEAAQDTAAAAPTSSSTSRTSMLTMEQLDALVLQGRGFGLNLEDKIEQLVQVKAKAEAWQREAMQYVSSQFSEGFKRIFVEYKRLITDYTASDNGAVLAFIPNRKASALTPSNQAKAAREEAALSAKTQSLLGEVLQVRAVAETIGVETPFYHTILVFIRILEWVEEARAAACLQSTSRRPASQRAAAAGRSSAAARHALTSWKGWEDVRVATRLKNWGDMDEELVLTLVREGGEMLKHLYPLEADEKLPGMLAHYAKGLLAAAVDFQDPEDVQDAEEGEMEEESAGEENASQGEADAAEGEAENEGETAAGKKRRQSASSSARKKKRVDAADETLSSPAGKATRGAYGISKKRVDNDFAETVNLNTLNASVPEKEKGQKNKRQRGGLGADDGDATTAAEMEPEVELDLAKTARRAGLDAYFESEATQKVRLAPGMAYMLDLWLRVLKILAMRLRVANRWVADAQRLLHLVGALSDGAEGEDAPVVVKGANTGEEAESLLNAAVQEGIQSKQRWVATCVLRDINLRFAHCFFHLIFRTLLETTVQESKEWLKRAADMRTTASALLTMDELKNFLKVGVLFFGHLSNRDNFVFILLRGTSGRREGDLRSAAQRRAPGPAQRAQARAPVEAEAGKERLRGRHRPRRAADRAGGRGQDHPRESGRVHGLHRAGEQDLLPLPPGLPRPDGGLRHLRGVVPFPVRGPQLQPGGEVRQVRVRALRAEEQLLPERQHGRAAHEQVDELRGALSQARRSLSEGNAGDLCAA